MAYLGAATSFASRGTLRVPSADWTRADSTSSLSLWPPGYPVAIAGAVRAGATPVQGARWVNAAAGAITAAATVGIVGGAVGALAGAVAAVVVFATPAIMDVHLSVLSEPLFLAVLILVLWAMIAARDRLLLLGVLSALAAMIRYAGACAPAAVVAWTLLDARHPMSRRIRRAALVAVVPALVIGGWVARTALASDRHGTPHVRLYGGWGATLAQARDTVAAWLVPLVPAGVLQSALLLVVALIALGFVLAAVRATSGRGARANRRPARESARRPYPVPVVLGAAALLAASLASVLVASRLLVGGTIPFDDRILAPVILLLEVMLVTAVAYWWRAYHAPLRIAVAVGGVAWLAAAVVTTTNDALYAVSEGNDFAGSDWRGSPLIHWVRAYGAGHPLYSNWPPALYFYTGRPARNIPDADQLRARELPRFGATLARTGGWLVGFAAPSPDVLPPDSVARLLGLRPLARFPDGSVWAAAPARQAVPAPGAPAATAWPVPAPGAGGSPPPR